MLAIAGKIIQRAYSANDIENKFATMMFMGLLINNAPYTVIGVMQKKTQMGIYGGPDANHATIPITTFKAQFGKDLGKYSFREWAIPFQPQRAGAYELKVKATNRIGQSQPMEPLWNPAGYMRNVVETVKVTAA